MAVPRVALRDHAGLAQHTEVMGGGRLGDRELEGDAGLVVVPIGELGDDRAPDRVRERGEHLVEGDLLDVGVIEGTHCRLLVGRDEHP